MFFMFAPTKIDLGFFLFSESKEKKTIDLYLRHRSIFIYKVTQRSKEKDESKDSSVNQIRLNDHIRNGVEDELHCLSIRCTSHVNV